MLGMFLYRCGCMTHGAARPELTCLLLMHCLEGSFEKNNVVVSSTRSKKGVATELTDGGGSGEALHGSQLVRIGASMLR